MLDTNGEIVQSPAFNPQLLLCFRLSSELQRARDTSSQSVKIQRFDERPAVLEWADLAVVRGWESNQVCSTLNHLSILALAVDHGLDPTESPLINQEILTSEPGLYSVPEDRDDE